MPGMNPACSMIPAIGQDLITMISHRDFLNLNQCYNSLIIVNNDMHTVTAAVYNSIITLLCAVHNMTNLDWYTLRHSHTTAIEGHACAAHCFNYINLDDKFTLKAYL